jgi:hypothetical protein
MRLDGMILSFVSISEREHILAAFVNNG